MSPRTFLKLTKIARSTIHCCYGNSRHVSFILRRNKILSVGWNNGHKTSVFAVKSGYRFGTIHAEVAALRTYYYPINTLAKCRMVNIRINRMGELCMAKPCNICNRILENFGLETWHTNELGEFTT
jgi:hypothetical protein